ncbi:hypothetical protein EIP86_003470 [Pleurotus ostreatoroseus]|nr:hypothetical protein EIP86_003470 [Pleurotus ostreatoroseus]
MRVYQQRLVYLDDGITFSSSDIDIPGCARWLFIAASHKSTISSYTILHASRSFEKFRNEHTTILLDRLRVVVHNWLDPHSVTPLAVPGRYQLPEHQLTVTEEANVQYFEEHALKVTLDYVGILGREHARVSNIKTLCHIIWVSDEEADKLEYPDPNAHKLLLDSVHSRRFIQCILSLTRYPALYDGGVELLFERRVGLAIKYLFGPWYASSSSEELTEAVQRAMAKKAHPTLVEMVKKLPPQGVLPAHYFILSMNRAIGGFVKLFYPSSA